MHIITIGRNIITIYINTRRDGQRDNPFRGSRIVVNINNNNCCK